MSMLSIIANKNILIEKIKELNDINFDSTSQLASYVINECLKAQYKMVRNVLQKNTLRKRHYSSDINTNDLLDSLYQHIYSHKFIALTDEIYEVKDAINIFKASEENTEKYDNSALLVVEELIDTFHFILEYTATLEEHYQITLCNKENINFDSLEYYFANENDFSDRVFKMLESEGTHIFSYLVDNKLIDVKETNKFKTLADPYKMLRINREIIRKTNFKDWKNYKEDFYSVYKFGEMFELNRQLYASFFQMMQDERWLKAVKKLIQSTDEKIEININSVKDVFKIVYGVYMGKLSENLRRQKEDPRYTGKQEGNIVGISV